MVVTFDDGPTAIVLRCPSCATELPGLDSDRVWACASCGHAWEAEEGRLAPRPYLAWRVPVDGAVVDDAPRADPRVPRVSGSVAGQGPAVWLPFWRVAFGAEVVCADAAALAAIERAAAPGRAWVRAFRLDGAFQIGDPGRALTEASHEESLAADRLPVCVGARIGSAEAIRLARLFVLARADVEADVTPAELRLAVTETAFVAVPFVASGRDVVCAIDGRSYRRSAMGDLAEVLATAAG